MVQASGVDAEAGGHRVPQRVARIGKPHGIRGEVTVEVLVRDPGPALEPGASLSTEPAEHGPLTITHARWNKHILLLTFDGVQKRDRALDLRNTLLLSEGVNPAAVPGEDEIWHEDHLKGLRVLVEGEQIGTVVGLEPRAAQDLLIVALSHGHEVLVPFVRAIVPQIALDAGYLRLEPPEGLLELNRGT